MKSFNFKKQQAKFDKKEIKTEPIWSLDLQYNEIIGKCSAPLYEIHPDGKRFSVFYYGCCEIWNSATIEGAKQFILGQLARFGVKLNFVE